MKVLIASLATTLISSSVFAGNRAAPEIDGTLSLLMIALVGGLALMLKKKKD
jgi:LPXTG-motif cell wall-anchored protein